MKEPKVNFSFGTGFLNGKRYEEFHGQEVRTWFNDVDEILQPDGGERLIHILFKSCFQEEVDFEPLGIAEILLLQQFECLPLVVVLDKILFDLRQDSDAETTSWDCGGFVLSPRIRVYGDRS